MKFECNVVHVYENSSDMLDIGHCWIMVKVTVDLQIFS